MSSRADLSSVSDSELERLFSSSWRSKSVRRALTASNLLSDGGARPLGLFELVSNSSHNYGTMKALVG